MTYEEFETMIRRRAIVMEIGGFPPPEDPAASWFGRVSMGRRDEPWPLFRGEPMVPLAQVNLTGLPFRPPRLEDVELLTVFIDPERLPLDRPNGDGWRVRTYPRIDELLQVHGPPMSSPIRPFPMRPRVVERDYPCWEDVAGEIPEDLTEEYEDRFENHAGFKLGGWPSLVQSEIHWGPAGRAHAASPAYVFQVDSDEKARWMWGDGGVGHFGRGTTPGHEHEWFLEWQCY